MELSVIIPVYNEAETIEETIRRVQQAKPSDKEIIVVDDGSTDGTRCILKGINEEGVKVIFHEKNMGKGGAVRTGLAHARGDIVIMQDADFEYDPREIHLLLKPIKDGIADVVYGSRFAGSKPKRIYIFWHKVGNRVITFIANVLYNSALTDVETCYKAFKRDFVKDIKIESNGFAVEPELTAKVIKKKGRIHEVPISYYCRKYNEGKKIRFYHGFEAIWALIKFRFFD